MIGRIKQLLAPLRYWQELPLRELADRPATAVATPSRIPPIVIQTWEDRLFGKSHLREMARFRDLNPELTFELWDRPRREAYLRTQWGEHPIFEIYQKSLFGPMKADIFRYCLMADRGGFYFDISKGCAAPLRTFYGPETEALDHVRAACERPALPSGRRAAPATPRQAAPAMGLRLRARPPDPAPHDRQHLRGIPALSGQGLRAPEGRHP
jgi:hypothetical protein